MEKNYLSNQIKAVFIPENIAEISQVTQQKCLTLQYYHYKCERSRNDKGNPCDALQSVILDCCFRYSGNIQLFYDRLHINAPYAYTLLFNPTFDDAKILTGYEDAIIVNGYIVNIEEQFDSTPLQIGESEQMLINIQLLLTEIIYVGKNSNKTLTITQGE